MVPQPARKPGQPDPVGTLAAFELDSAHGPPMHTHALRRWMHLLEDALDRAHPGLKPYQLRRLAATWTADSLSDSLSLAVHIEMNVLVARVRPARGGALRGLVTYHGEAPGSPAHPPPLGEFEWRRVDCDSLALDRTYDQSELLRNPHDTRQVRRSSSQQLQVIISRSSTMSCACQR